MVSPNGSRCRSGKPTSITKHPPGSRCAATFWKQATCASCVDEVLDRVVDEVGDPEGAVHSRRREVADHDRDALASRLRTQAPDHRLGKVDPVHLDAALCQRQCNAPRADAELERAPVTRKPGEEVDDGIDRLGREHRMRSPRRTRRRRLRRSGSPARSGNRRLSLGARSKTSSPSLASTRTVSPSPNSPSSSRSASGFSTRRWIARLSGRAPYVGSQPASASNCFASSVSSSSMPAVGEPRAQALRAAARRSPRAGPSSAAGTPRSRRCG